MNSMPHESEQDVPSPIDLRDPQDASVWMAEADLKRPWRQDLRACIAELLRERLPAPLRVLGLRSGPGCSPRRSSYDYDTDPTGRFMRALLLEGAGLTADEIDHVLFTT